MSLMRLGSAGDPSLCSGCSFLRCELLRYTHENWIAHIVKYCTIIAIFIFVGSAYIYENKIRFVGIWYDFLAKQIGVFAKQGDLMAITSVKVSAKYQIVVPQFARKKLNIKKGDHLLVDVQDGVIVLIPEPKRYSNYLQGLHSEIWQGIDVQEYINGERDARTDVTNS